MNCRFVLARILKIQKYYSNTCFIQKNLSTTPENVDDSKDSKLSGFAEAYRKHADIDALTKTSVKEPSFATLLRNSKFIDLGDPEGRIVTGTIFHIVNDDLYIDFGWKFHCVCTRPNKNPSDYVRGAKVKLRIKDLELSTKFLGQDKDLTILEADVALLGILYSPARSK